MWPSVRASALLMPSPRLAEQLGIPVIPIQANRGKGLDRLKEALRGKPPPPARTVVFPEAFDHEVSLLQNLLGSAEPVYPRTPGIARRGRDNRRTSRAHEAAPTFRGNESMKLSGSDSRRHLALRQASKR